MPLTSMLIRRWESLHSQKIFVYHKACFEAFHVDGIDWARTVGNLRYYYHRHDSGGHFAAVEKPEVLVGDIREFLKVIKREAKL
jgi:hypothetical protein